MTYRDYPREHSHLHQHHRPRPLVDLIPDNRNDLDVSDEEDGFYGREDDFLIPAKWQSTIARTVDRLPRRIKRYSAVFIILAFFYLVAWVTYFGPRYSEYSKELKAMDTVPVMSYGSQVRPEFKAMVQVRDMDAQNLPKKHSRLVFVGDVHGCREELEHLLEKVHFNHKHDHLVLVGDMVSKGPDSPGVIKLAQKLGASCVRGNWEDKLLLSIAEAQQKQHHQASPGTTALDEPIDMLNTPNDETVLSRTDHKLRNLAQKFTHSEIAFLQQCPVILRVGDVPDLGSLVVVHAGLVPGIPLDQQDPFHAMNMRTIDLKTRIPSSTHDGGVPWENFWNHAQEKLPENERVTVIYGHNKKRGLNIQKYTYGLDSGCVGGGKLTALVVDSRGKTEIIHVKCKEKKGYDMD